MPELAPDPTQLSRLELLQLAQSLGVSDADVMTRAELRAAIDKARRPEPPRVEQYPITWVSVARRLLASVVERGLNLPDAASLIRGDTKLTTPPKPPPPVATVTLARIYGAQGHVARAVATLNEVLESDPDHEIARDLRNQLEQRRRELLTRAAATEGEEVSAPDDQDDVSLALSGRGVDGGEVRAEDAAAVGAGLGAAGLPAAAADVARSGESSESGADSAPAEGLGAADVAPAHAGGESSAFGRDHGFAEGLGAADVAPAHASAASVAAFSEWPLAASRWRPAHSIPDRPEATDAWVADGGGAEVPSAEAPFADSTPAAERMGERGPGGASGGGGHVAEPAQAHTVSVEAGFVPDTERFPEPPPAAEPPPFLDSGSISAAEPLIQESSSLPEPSGASARMEPASVADLSSVAEPPLVSEPTSLEERSALREPFPPDSSRPATPSFSDEPSPLPASSAAPTSSAEPSLLAGSSPEEPIFDAPRTRDEPPSIAETCEAEPPPSARQSPELLVETSASAEAPSAFGAPLDPATGADGALSHPAEPHRLAAETPSESFPADWQRMGTEALPWTAADSEPAASLPADLSPAPSAPAASSPDVNAELVAPTFDTVERSGLADAPTERPSAFVTETPTMVAAFEPPRAEPDGALPGDSVAPDDDVDTEPPATIASDVELTSIEPPPPIAPATIAATMIEATMIEAMASGEPALGDESHAGPEATGVAAGDVPLLDPTPAAPSSVEPAPLEPAPGGIEEPPHAPNGIARGATSGAPLDHGGDLGTPAGAQEPRVPGLVLIETGTPVRYVYWELADAALGAPHWIHVVSHTPTARGGTERHERRFPVHRRLGVLRLEGVPARAVLRARLTDASDGRPLVVAGAVRPRAAGPFEVRFSPHPSAKPDALASRAQPLLERASAVYWDG